MDAVAANLNKNELMKTENSTNRVLSDGDENQQSRPLAVTGCRFSDFIINFKNGEEVFVEDSVMWYCLERGPDSYLALDIHGRINEKAFYYS